MRRREGVSPRALKKFKFNSLLSLSLASPRHFRVAFTFSLARTMLILGPPKDGAASPPRPAADFRTGLCAAARPPRRGFCFSWQRPGRCATWPGAVRTRVRACASVCALLRFLTLSFSVSFSLPLSLKTPVYHSNKKKKSILMSCIYFGGRQPDGQAAVCVCNRIFH